MTKKKRLTISFPPEFLEKVKAFKSGIPPWDSLKPGPKIVAIAQYGMDLDVQQGKAEATPEGMAGMLSGHTDQDVAAETTLTKGRVAEIRQGSLLTDAEIVQLAHYLAIEADSLRPYRAANKGPQKQGNGHGTKTSCNRD